ncbi:hypothetical protein Dfri01_10070 [Dyadobacter frigoris]|uniref:restriction endonuclease subunit S n=1 Tax=Dyadobacter frigoris TaxID=2576211 RepID=UPI0024A13D58|nr:restriction endonuclease subunit S [Dyadobacter frigoris]GLU51546.1 hypothetical protein Dfri01_10070 [Dyadobacter frigoris]
MSDFKKYKFSELYEMSSGISSKPEQAGHGFPFLSFKAVFNNYFLPDGLEDLMDTSVRDRNSSSIKKGDIFLTRTSETLDELGMSSVATKDYPDATFSGFLKRLRPLQDDVTYDKYMAFYLRSKYFRKIMTNNSIMTLRASLNEQIFSYLNLILPDYEVQKSIGDLLYSVNQKIEVNNKINSELEAIAKMLYDYWFVQFDFPNEEGKPYKASGGEMEYNEVLKREIPEGWEARSLGQLGEFKNGINYDPKAGGDSVARIINVRNISKSSTFIENNDLDELELNVKDINKYLVNEHSILIARSGNPGATRLINDYKHNTIYCGFIINFNIENITDKFLIFYSLKDFEINLSQQSNGTIMKNVNQEVLKGMCISYPQNVNIIRSFNDIITPILSKISSNQKQKQELTSLRDWLLPMLMNGQVTVRQPYIGQEVTLVPFAMAAEPVAVYGRAIKLNIPDKSKVFAKQVLGGKIVSLFKDDPNFTHIKFQKLQYLAEHIAEADLDLNYYFQTAGPHDGRFMHTIADKLKNSKWFEERNYKFYPLEKQDKIDGYYQGYFAPAQDRLKKLFHLLSNVTEAEAEIFATLYAVWNNRIILKQPILETDIIEDFYKWSDRKLQYSKEQLLKSLEILRINQMVPTGFGKEIKTAKNKSK